MIPANVQKIGESTWLDVREHPVNLTVITCENEEVRPILLPYETRMCDYTEIARLVQNVPNVIVLCENHTVLPSTITNNKTVIIRRFSKERLQRQVPRKVNVWIQWFPHSNPDRAVEFQTAFEQNVKCDLVDRVYQLSERDYTNAPFLQNPKVTILSNPDRLTFNSFFKIVRTIPVEDPNDFHVLINADIEWTREASLGLEYCLWETSKLAISTLRWEDTQTLYGVRCDSQDSWGFIQGTLPDPSKLTSDVPLGKPGCDNRILIELLVQGFQSLNHPLQFPTIHHHATQIRDYSSADVLPRPFLLLKPQWNCPLFSKEDTWIRRIALNLRNRVFPLLPDSIVNETIKEHIQNRNPFSIGKVGQIEAETVTLYHNLSTEETETFGTVRKQYPPRIRTQIYENAGVFPNDRDGIGAFSRLYQHAMSSCDILSVSYPWLVQGWGEQICLSRGSKTNQLSCRISATEPFFVNEPFTKEFADKKVTVISPFVDSFKKQLKNRKNIWGPLADNLLPATTQWRFIKSPLSAGIVPPVDTDWVSMIQRLTQECFPENREDWPDIVLSGFGPGGLCICQEAKERGRIGISMGGGLQILFGVRGKRWDSNEKFQKFFNKHWVRPSRIESPKDHTKVEQGCYW